MDIERTMQFILDQQAQFSSDLARINSVLLGSAERQGKFEQTILKLEQTILELEQTTLELEQTNLGLQTTILELGKALLRTATTQEGRTRFFARSASHLNRKAHNESS